MTAAPITFRWDGEVMRPVGARAKKESDAEFVIGHLYALEERMGRSEASHNHYFAALTEAWRNLPEELAEIYPTIEHLRKRALIEAGFYDETIIETHACDVADIVANEFRRRDDFSLVIINGSIIIVRDAKSQSRRAMDARTFQASKEAALRIVADMIGVEPDDLKRNAGGCA